MTDEKRSDEPPTETEGQPSLQTPMAPSAPDQHEVRDNADSRPQDEEKETIKLEKQIRSGERWLIGISAASVIINIVIALIYYGQLRQMRTATEKARISADAAKSAADTASAALKSSDLAFQIQQRPYMVSTIPHFNNPPSAGQRVRASITLKNIGKTPANYVDVNLRIRYYRVTQSPERYRRFIDSNFSKLRVEAETGREKQLGRKDVAPGDTFFFTTDSPIPLSPEEAKTLQTDIGEFTVFYMGVVTYNDSFKNLYNTEFCYFFFGTDLVTWHICDSNNTIK